MDRRVPNIARAAVKDSNALRNPVMITKAMMFLEQPLIVDENECIEGTTRELKARLRRDGLRAAMRSITNETEKPAVGKTDKGFSHSTPAKNYEDANVRLAGELPKVVPRGFSIYSDVSSIAESDVDCHNKAEPINAEPDMVQHREVKPCEMVPSTVIRSVAVNSQTKTDKLEPYEAKSSKLKPSMVVHQASDSGDHRDALKKHQISKPSEIDLSTSMSDVLVPAALELDSVDSQAGLLGADCGGNRLLAAREECDSKFWLNLIDPWDAPHPNVEGKAVKGPGFGSAVDALLPALEDLVLSREAQREGLRESRLDRVLSVAEYSRDIYENLREAETRHRPRGDYFRKQRDVTLHMRAVLVDWLVEVTDNFRLQRETLCLAVGCIDRFLSCMSVTKAKLQLVGVTALFIAAKYEETQAPTIKDFVYICDGLYTVTQIQRMEKVVLRALMFDVTVPTSSAFCEQILKESRADENTRSMAMFLLELSLVDAELSLLYLPSVLACACICIANYSFHHPVWSTELMDLTEYTLADFTECIGDLYQVYSESRFVQYQAVRNKYQRSEFHEVARLEPRPSPFKDE